MLISVILVTNALHFLKHKRVSRIVVVNNGSIVEQGTYDDLANKAGSLFANFMKVIKECIPWQREGERDWAGFEAG